MEPDPRKRIQPLARAAGALLDSGRLISRTDWQFKLILLSDLRTVIEALGILEKRLDKALWKDMPDRYVILENLIAEQHVTGFHGEFDNGELSQRLVHALLNDAPVRHDPELCKERRITAERVRTAILECADIYWNTGALERYGVDHNAAFKILPGYETVRITGLQDPEDPVQGHRHAP